MRIFDQKTTSSREERVLEGLQHLRRESLRAADADAAAQKGLDRWVPPMPLKVQIQTTTRCNAACTMCPYPEITAEDGFSHDQMSEELFLLILEQLRGAPVERLSLFLMNEPLLDVRLADWLKASRQALPDTTLGLFTNGSALTAQRARQLVEAGLSELCVSVHGFERQEYEEVMRRLSFDRLQKNLMEVVRLHRNGALGDLDLKVVTGDVPEITATLEALDPLLREYVLVKGFSNERQVVRVEPGLSSSPIRSPSAAAICQRPFVKLYITTAGDCVLCNVDWRKSVVLGRVGPGPGESIQEIWQGERYREVRARHVLGKFPDPLICGRCDYAAVVDDE